MNRNTRLRRAAAMIAALGIMVEPSAHLLLLASGQAPPPQTTTATGKPTPAATTAKPAATAAAATTTPVDGGWPRLYDLPSGGSILVYQPQIATWDKQAHMVAFSAVSLRNKAGDKPALGTVKLEADTKVAVTDRLVSFQQMKITEASFQTLPKEQVREITGVIEQAIPNDERVIALDRILANVDKSTIVPRTVEGIKADPPTIFFSKTPAVIVNLDGDPIWSPIKGNDLKYAVNTNWDLFENTPTKTYYLRNNDAWLKAADVKGPWSPAGALPDGFKQLPAEENWNDVKANLPGKAIKTAPRVFVSTTPAELILLTGEPSYLLVQGSNLLWVSNTESDVFRLGKTGPVYYLVAGRWFSAPDFAGPWAFATPSLPEDFKKIPLSHDRSRVLASVPGTDQAAEAVLLAQIPQTARVNKKEAKAPDVAFQGNPEFAPIEKTTVERAVNTDKDVFKIGDLYYMCYQGVWFSGKSATGPWEVASSVPKEIYQIPSSSPAHHVTYVTVEDNDDDWVTYAAAAGYTGMMVAWGCTVWGTGWYYPPYWGYGAYYPYLLWSLPDLRILRVVQPVDGRIRTQRSGVWPIRRRRRWRALQPADGDLRTRRGRVRSVRSARRRTSLQPANRNLRGHASGIQRVRKLGIDGRAARRRLGQDQSLHESTDREHDAHDQNRRRIGRHASWSGRRDGRRRRRRERLRRKRRERLSSPGRDVAEVRQRRLVEYRSAAQRRETNPAGPAHDARAAGRSRHHGSRHDGSIESRRGRAPRRLTADRRLRKLSRRQRHSRHRQLSGWRREPRWRHEPRRRRKKTVERFHLSVVSAFRRTR